MIPDKLCGYVVGAIPKRGIPRMGERVHIGLQHVKMEVLLHNWMKMEVKS